MTYPFDAPRGALTQRAALSRSFNASPGFSAARALPTRPLPCARSRQLPRRAARFSYMDRHGKIIEVPHIFPDMPDLATACAAFARGTLIATDSGQVAVEDLQPGDRIMTRDNEAASLRWIGSTAINYRADTAHSKEGSLRVLTGALGHQHPQTDLILHHDTRVVVDHPICAMQHGVRSALVPARALADFDSIITLRPIGAVEFFNLILDRHQIIFANGLETESYHPGPEICALHSGEMHHHMAHLFPWMEGRLERFGPMALPRLCETEVAALTQA